MIKKLSMDQINPCLRKAGMEEIRTQINTRRFIYDYELIYCHEGILTINYDTHTLRIEPGTILIISPGVAHQVDTRSLLEAYWVHFDFYATIDQGDLARFIEINHSSIGHLISTQESLITSSDKSHLIREELLITPNKILPNYYKVNNRENTKTLYLAIIKSFNAKETTWFLETKSYLSQLLLETFGHLKEDSTVIKSHSLLVDQVKTYLAQYDHRYVSIKELSKQFYYHSDTLNRIFKKETGLTIGLYTRQKRHEKVKSLLTSSDLTLENIAELTGFTDRSHLIKSFRKLESKSPNEYRNELLTH